MARKNFINYFVWSLAVAFFVYQFVLRLTPGALFEEIMVKYDINATNFAILSGFYYLGYAGMQIPLGYLLDRFGVRYVVAAGSLICVIGNMQFVYFDHWYAAIFGRLLIGLGSAAGVLGTVKAISLAFNKDNISKMIGWSVTIALIGAIYGKNINVLMIEYFGWTKTIIYLSIPGLIISFLIVFVCRDSSDNINPTEISHFSLLASIKEILKRPTILFIGFFGAMLVGPLEAYADVWGVPFLIEMYNFTKEQSAYISSSAIYFGMCIGSPLLASIADKFANHNKLNIMCGLFMAIFFIIIISGIVSNFYVLFVLNFCIGIMCAYQVIIFAQITLIMPQAIAGLTISFVNMINMAAGYLFNYAFGKIMQLNWQGEIVDNIPQYSVDSYVCAMYIFPITLIAGAVGFFAINSKLSTKMRKVQV